ncbi:hypothetical protein FM106_28650 [Brachybacterium faecium]|nr:hypothetical protein FM106_28650 [Brachybacterium faecium]
MAIIEICLVFNLRFTFTFFSMCTSPFSNYSHSKIKHFALSRYQTKVFLIILLNTIK